MSEPEIQATHLEGLKNLLRAFAEERAVILSVIKESDDRNRVQFFMALDKASGFDTLRVYCELLDTLMGQIRHVIPGIAEQMKITEPQARALFLKMLEHASTLSVTNEEHYITEMLKDKPHAGPKPDNRI